MQNLFKKYLDNKCSPEEVKQLVEHFNAAENELALKNLIRESLENDFSSADEADSQWNQAVAETYNRIKNQIAGEKVKVLPFFKKTWFRIATAAASVIIILSALSFFLLQGRPQKAIVKVQDEKKFENDIEPGGDKAILTLADGRKIILDSTKNGNIAQQGSSTVVKSADGQLTYNTTNAKQPEVLYNTVSTPRGGQYKLVLPDGSKVWLNAASSIHFPNVFTGGERKVEVTGEVYFEVTKNASRPFKVFVNPASGDGGMEVEVLGTHFNINSYGDEEVIKTTLLEGAVKVKKGNNLRLLSPGQQAQLNSNGEIQLNHDVNIEETMAWKNGKFIFNGNDIQSVMRQLEKWYDIEVEYKGDLTKEEFVGIISRDVNISQILNMLEKTRAVNFKIKGRKIIVE